ncbi:MAG: dipeptidase [Anaerolineales bacterium]|nr:dipeptidase [Anaerolineales bacterium]
MLEKALTYARANRQSHLSQLQDWLRIPSVSTLPEHKDDVRRAAQFAADKLSEMGFPRVDIDDTPGHPIVYAERTGLSAPTLLIYGHFDVQPVDPFDAWTRPPFEPVIEGDNLYARGASDDKGQAFAVLVALESYLKTSGELPVNVKVLLEGEEEIISPNLFPYLQENANKLAADAILIADQDMLDPKVPVVMWGVRGNLYVEIEVRGPAHDLHSGTFGGSVDNPFNVLARLLASLQDGETRKVLVPGFYDKVQALTDEERALIAQAPINDEIGLYLTGAPALGGEIGYPLAERVSVRPTLDIHGIAGGFTGKGMKTVIPSKATGKVSMRLVPDQTPDEIADLLETHLRKSCPPIVQMELRIIGKAEPVKIDYKSPAVQAAATAYERGFGASPVFLRGGGSLPIVRAMIDELSQPGQGDIPIVMIGFGLPDDRTHAPNEKFHLPNFYNGIETVIHYLDLFKSK